MYSLSEFRLFGDVIICFSARFLSVRAVRLSTAIFGIMSLLWNLGETVNAIVMLKELIEA